MTRTRRTRKTSHSAAVAGPGEQTNLFPDDASAAEANVPAPNALERATAAAQFAGFVYQFHRAVDALFDLKEGEALGFEVLDDYHVEEEKEPRSLTQVKLHHNAAVLTDGAADLWKTLGTWARAVADGSLNLSTIQRVCLLTTAVLPEGSVAAAVAEGQPAEEIVKRLLAVPRSHSETLGRDFDAVHALDPDDLLCLVERLSIEGSAAPLGDAHEMLQRRLRAARFHAGTLTDARAALVGWAEGLVVSALAERRGPVITEAAFHLALTNIRDRFTQEALPARHVNAELSEAEYAGQAGSVFVRQLNLVAAGPETVRRAIRDYLRAVKERTTWIDRSEILPDRLGAYDRDLVERWEPMHEQCCEECRDADNDGLCAAGLRHYRAISLLDFPIDHRWRYRYLTTGSYHSLANMRHVGWHPKYKELLGGASGSGSDAGTVPGGDQIPSQGSAIARAREEPTGE